MSTGTIARSLSSTISFRVIMTVVIAAFFGLTISTYLTTNERPVQSDGGDITIMKNGTVLQGSRRVSHSIIRKDGSSIDLVLHSGSKNEPIIADYYFNIILPGEIDPELASAEVISIQGLQEYTPQFTTSQTFQVAIPGVLDEGLTKIRITLPPNYLREPWYVKIASQVIDYSVLQWSIISIILLMVGLLYSKFISLQLGVHTKSIQDVPPTGLSPLEVAIVTRGTITADDMSAFIYDIANRGYLQIIAKPGSTYVLPQESEMPLANYESHIIPLVAPYSTPMPLVEILSSLQNDMFSLTISASYEEIYTNLTNKGIFQDNPRLVHLKYKTIAILIQLMSVIQVVISYFFLSTTPGLVIVGLSGYLVGLFIHQNGYRSLRLTPYGKEVTAQIHQFKAYLMSSKPIGTAGAQGDLFYKYLPYAMVLGCQDEWYRRFSKVDFQIPQWFLFEGVSFYTPTEFVNHVRTIAQEIGTVFTRLKDPNVD